MLHIDNRIIRVLLFIASFVAIDNAYCKPKWQEGLLQKLSTNVMLGYQGIHQSGPSLHVNTAFKKKIAIDLGYGTDFLNSITGTAKYYLNQGESQFYTGIGYGYFNLKQRKEYLFEINTAHLVLGYQSVFKKHWVINTEISFVKYLNEKFRLPSTLYTANYNLNEKIYFEVGIAIGYRFNWIK